MKWSDLRWMQIFVALSVGVFLGGSFSRGWHRYRMHHPMDGHERVERMLHKLSSKLDLTADQKIKLAAILEEKRLKVEQLRTQTGPQFEAIRESAREEIRKILNLEQQKKFDVLDAKMRERWKRN
jgi:Spy/CpxP family protein refolding chaperone